MSPNISTGSSGFASPGDTGMGGRGVGVGKGVGVNTDVGCMSLNALFTALQDSEANAKNARNTGKRCVWRIIPPGECPQAWR